MRGRTDPRNRMTAKKPATPTKAARPAAKAKPAAVELKKKAPTAAKPAEPVAKGKVPPPKKGKADDKAAKPDASDVDLSDLESDLEGEPVSAEVEAAAKAKPLRMKVSRAKERALMREFGLDET